jgi:hypothetical protein
LRLGYWCAEDLRAFLRKAAILARMAGTIVYLNGVPSAGKTTIGAREWVAPRSSTTRDDAGWLVRASGHRS